MKMLSLMMMKEPKFNTPQVLALGKLSHLRTSGLQLAIMILMTWWSNTRLGKALMPRVQ